MKAKGNVQITAEQLVEAQTALLKAMTPIFMAMRPQVLQDRIIGNQNLASNLQHAFFRMPKVLVRVGEFTVDSDPGEDFDVFEAQDHFKRKLVKPSPDFVSGILAPAKASPDPKPLHVSVYDLRCSAIDEEIVAVLTTYQFGIADAGRCIAHLLNKNRDRGASVEWFGEHNSILYTPSGTAFVRWDRSDRHWLCYKAGMNAWEWFKGGRIFALEA